MYQHLWHKTHLLCMSLFVCRSAAKLAADFADSSGRMLYLEVIAEAARGGCMTSQSACGSSSLVSSEGSVMGPTPVGLPSSCVCATQRFIVCCGAGLQQCPCASLPGACLFIV